MTKNDSRLLYAIEGLLDLLFDLGNEAAGTTRYDEMFNAMTKLVKDE